MKALFCLALLSLTGCTLVREHPYVTSFAVAVAAGSIIASTTHDNRTTPEMRHIGNPNCANGMCQ